MRRAILLIVGFGTGGLLFVFLMVSMAEQCMLVQAQEPTVPLTLAFPCTVEGTDLQVLELVSYEGPFWEDGSDEEVAGIAALVVENTGILQLAQGAVILEWGSARMVFEMTTLPPGARALVLEKDRTAFRRDLPEGCYGWSREEYPEDNGAVVAREGNALTITNVTQSIVPFVTVSFKNYDTGSGIYIGGITYTAQENLLLPGETRTIVPYHYACHYSRVINITSAVVE